MVFELQVKSNTPLVGEDDPDIVAKTFFEQIGYLSKGADPSLTRFLLIFSLNTLLRHGLLMKLQLISRRQDQQYIDILTNSRVLTSLKRYRCLMK